jgi:hypothetical protein
MRPREADLAITALVAVMTCAAAGVGAPVAVMTVLGVLLFAAPGYLLGQLLIGSDGSGLERVAAAAGLVFCVPIIGVLLLYAAGLPLRRATWLALLAGVTLVSDVVLFLARRRQSAGTRRPPEGLRLPRMRVAAAFGVAAVIAVGAVGVARAGVSMQHYPGYTQLWLDRHPENAPTVDLGVANDEGSTVRYRLVLDDGHTAAIWNLTLANGQVWHRSPRYSGRYAISVKLFRLPDVTTPYRYVDLNGDGKP